MVRNIFIIALSIVLFSCKGKIDRLLMSDDVEMKEQKAKEFFENCDYASASPLFKDLIQSYSTSAKVEKVYFYFAYCDYKLEDYMLAAYEFRKIIEKFPRGKYSERAQFLLADSYFNSTPKYNLDQEYNQQAVEEFQVFLEKYPSSDKRQIANDKIDLLIEKREKKDFENAKLFYNTRDYKAALQSFQFVLNDFPDTKRDEELYFLLVESAYMYAEKSIEHKKAARFGAVNEYATTYLKKYEQATAPKYLSKVVAYQKKAKEKALDLEYSLPGYYYKKKKYDQAINLWGELLNKKEVKDKGSIAESLLNACYEKALNAEKKDKIEAVNSFVEVYDRVAGKLNQDEVAKWKSKNEYFLKLQKEIPLELPYDFLSSGEYKEAVDYFQQIADTADLSKGYNDKMFFNYILAKHKYALKLREVPAKSQWDEVVSLTKVNKTWENGKYQSKIKTLLKEVGNEMDNYPLVLISNPMKRKNYVLALQRAKVQIDKENTLKDREEVVHLLLLSSLKKARSLKKYERLPQYKNAKLDYEKYASLLKEPILVEKGRKIEEKINKGITKYQNK